MRVYFVFERDGWVEYFVCEMRYRYQWNGNGNLLGYPMKDMFAIRPSYNRDDAIVLVPAGWRPFEPSRLIQSPSPWLDMLESHA